MSNTPSTQPKDGCDCDQCPLTPRRDFVRGIGASVIAALVAAGLPPRLAAMVRPRTLEAIGMRDADPVYPIPAGDDVSIDKKNDVILVRWKNTVYAFNLSCPHQNTALRWDADGHEFQCPKHHSHYQPDGTFIGGRATRNMDRFSMTRDGSNVVVHVNAMHQSDNDRSGWAAAALPAQ